MQKSSIKWLGLWILLSGLSACATFHPQPAAPVYQVESKQQRIAALQRIQSWRVQGSVSIQHGNKTDLASLQWTQLSQNYQFGLFGPLGFGQVGITGRPGAITLTRTNQPPVSAASPELLMQQQLGWQIPVSNLYYWARGLAAPGVPAKTAYDHYNHLTQLEQQGWRITYLEYMSVDGVDLPKKMQLSTQDLAIKLAVRSWQLGE